MTLLKTLLGILPRTVRVTGGSIRFETKDLLTLPLRQLSDIMGSEISLIEGFLFFLGKEKCLFTLHTRSFYIGHRFLTSVHFADVEHHTTQTIQPTWQRVF